MPLVDLPLKQLLEYQGRNPKPADFDAFWNAGLAEMNALDPDVELRPHALNASFAKCYELYFTGTGNSRIYAKYLRPAFVDESVPCILQFHGYSGSSGADWNGYLNLVAQGFAVAALDCRGQGGKSNDEVSRTGTTQNGHIIRGLDNALNGQPEKLYYRDMFLDTAMLARIVGQFPEIDENRLSAQGGSQGGALTLACAALSPIKRAAPVFPFLCDYQRVWEMDLAAGAYGELKTYFRNFDPLHKRESEIFNALGYIDIQHLMPRVSAEVLMAVGLMDTTCPPSTQFAAFNKIPSKKNTVFFPDFGHEGLPGWGDLAWEFLTQE